MREKHGKSVKTCWIAHCKELKGLPVRRAPNRIGETRIAPCEDSANRAMIFEAFDHFEMT